MSVVLMERKHLGGSCVNFGCTPTKAALASARVAHLARRAREFGLEIPAVRVDFGAVIQRAREIAEESRHGLEKALKNSDNPKLMYGRRGLRDGGARVSASDRAGASLDGRSSSAEHRAPETPYPAIPGSIQSSFWMLGNWLARSTNCRSVWRLSGRATSAWRWASFIAGWEAGKRLGRVAARGRTRGRRDLDRDAGISREGRRSVPPRAKN